MNRNIQANIIDYKTFDYLKVNETETSLPQINIKPYPVKSDERPDINYFRDKKHGVSQELLELNEKSGNLYKFYDTNKNPKINITLDLVTDDDNIQLLDTHDIIAEENSQVSLLLNYKSEGNKEKFRNSIIRIYAKKHSNVSVFIIQDEDNLSTSMESIYVYNEEESSVNIHQYELGAKKTFTNFMGDVVGNKSELIVDSIYFAHGTNELNMLYGVNQYGEESFSDVLVNGVLKDEAYKNFKSTLDFKKGSLFAKGSEEEYAILLDDDVHAVSVPALLAHEDSVEGNHAVSAGKIDHDLMFYIMSRGFSEEEAQTLIVQSKFTSAIDRIEDEKLRDSIWTKISSIMKGDNYVK